MRIQIDIDEARDVTGRKAVRVRTRYRRNPRDCVRVANCGIEIYECIKQGFDTAVSGGIIEHLGERQ